MNPFETILDAQHIEDLVQVDRELIHVPDRAEFTVAGGDDLNRAPARIRMRSDEPNGDHTILNNLLQWLVDEVRNNSVRKRILVDPLHRHAGMHADAIPVNSSRQLRSSIAKNLPMASEKTAHADIVKHILRRPRRLLSVILNRVYTLLDQLGRRRGRRLFFARA